MIRQTSLWQDFKDFNVDLWRYGQREFLMGARRFEAVKGIVVGSLYKKRGKYVRPFLHSVMMLFLFFGVAFGPKVVAQAFPGKNDSVWDEAQTPRTAEADVSLYDTGLVTIESDKPRSQVIDYEIKDGDTLSSIAKKFGVSMDTIRWANPKVNWKRIKPGEKVKVPPVTGIVYKVKNGDTIYSIAKKFKTNPQGIVDFPFNSFVDDENFTLVAGQTLIVPDGVMPDTVTSPQRVIARVLTPNAGTVSATGSFVWPAAGRITQGYHWYHRAIDIANHHGGPILAADSGKIIRAGWTNVGYGNYIMIDHGNGYVTLYAHLSRIQVVVGQTVKRGDVIGQVGSTGRSTGTHLHFEIRKGNSLLNPLNLLQ